jgi:hypothetical protein
MEKLLVILLAMLCVACAAPQPASCDGSNLRPINQQHQSPVEESAQ